MFIASPLVNPYCSLSCENQLLKLSAAQKSSQTAMDNCEEQSLWLAYLQTNIISAYSRTKSRDGAGPELSFISGGQVSSASALRRYKNILRKMEASKAANLELLLITNYIQHTGKTGGLSSNTQNLVISVVEDIIERGFIWANKRATFRFLSLIFKRIEITEVLRYRYFIHCLERFSTLHIWARQYIFREAVNVRQEHVCLNLISYGIDLNWRIDFDGQGVRESSALRLLENFSLSELLYRPSYSNKWDKETKNHRGENFLHILSSGSIADDWLIDQLKISLEKISLSVISKLLKEKNNRGNTPLQEAIISQHESMIDFILYLGAEKWGHSSAALESVTYYLSKCEDEGGAAMWQKLKKNLESERLKSVLDDCLAKPPCQTGKALSLPLKGVLSPKTVVKL